MIIRWSGYMTEFFLYVLALGITFSNAAAEAGVAGVMLSFFIRYLVFKPKDIAVIKDRGVTGFPSISVLIFFLIYITILFISFLRSPYPQESLKVFLRILRFFVLYIALVDFFYGNTRRINRFFWVLVCISGITFLNGIFQYFAGYDLFRHYLVNTKDYLYRINASFVHPNDFAAYIISVLPLAGFMFMKGISRHKRVLLMLVCALGIWCLLKTSSRSGWVGFVLAMTMFFYFYNKKFVFIVPVVALLLIVVTPHGVTRVTSLFKNEQSTVWERTQLWRGTWRMVKEHPIMGFGLNTYSKVFPTYKPAEYPDVRYTHNSYLQMWSEIGIVGLLSFLGIVAAILRKILRGFRSKMKERKGRMLLCLFTGFVAFLIQSAFDTNFFSLVLMIHFWALSAYMVACNAQLERDLTTQNK